MNQPILYHNSNDVQRYDSEEILREFKEKFQQLSNTKYCELLDIGCGDGYVTAKILMEYISKDIHVTAVDKADSMIDFAANTFCTSKVKFEVMNIDKPEESFLNRFDYITSFYCFHLVEDHSKLMQNIYSMMKPGGQCLFIYPFSHVVFDAYKILMKTPEWSNVMKNANKYMPRFQNALDSTAVCKKNLIQSGFTNIRVEIRNRNFMYEGVKDFEDFLMSVNPFIDMIPNSQKEDYKNDLLEVIWSLPTVRKHVFLNAKKEYINIEYSIMIGYFEKNKKYSIMN